MGCCANCISSTGKHAGFHKLINLPSRYHSTMNYAAPWVLVISNARKLTLKWLATLALILVSTMSYAEGEKFSIPDQPTWKEECGGCHLTFPPQMLAKENWRQLMSGLNKHFGANATLEPDVAKEILDFLQSQAGSVFDGHRSETGMRITDTPWFSQKHGLVPNKTWYESAIKSKSNCKACHIKAERGVWSEHDGSLGYCRGCHK